MRTKEFDVWFDGSRLSIVRLRDGAIVADAEIPAEARAAVATVLSAFQEPTAPAKAGNAGPEPTATTTPKKTTRKKTSK